MHAAPAPSFPRMTFYKPRALARVRLNGHAVYLGPWGSAEAQQKYDHVIQLWLANGRSWPPSRPLMGTVTLLGDAFLAHARSYYVKADRLTKSVPRVERVLELLHRSGLGRLAPEEFGPQALKRFQRWLAADTHGRWSRETINEYAATVVAMFKWAVSEELLEESSWRALQAVPGLRRGRAPAPGIPAPRDNDPVEPPEPEALEAVRTRAGPMLRDMIDLQLLTGMRPGELLNIRVADLRESGTDGVLAYDVREDVNKLEHHAKPRTVFIGPKGAEILRRWAPEDPEQYIFSPRRAEELRRAQQRDERATPLWPSHSRRARRRRRRLQGQRPLRLAPRYSADAYRRAITRLCEAVNTERVAAAAGRGDTRPPVLLEPWSPNQLRHAAASFIAEHEAVEVAQFLLGHSDIKTTMRYVTVACRRAAAAALKHG